MAIAPATLDFDSFGKLMRPAVPADAPIMEALKACLQLERAPVGRSGCSRGTPRCGPSDGARTSPRGRRLDFAFAVVRGKIRAVCRAVNGREISMECFVPAIRSPMGRWRRDPLAHDWEAVEASMLLIIPRETFLSCLRSAPELALALGRSWWPGSSARSSLPPGSRWRACRNASCRAWLRSAARMGRLDRMAC